MSYWEERYQSGGASGPDNLDDYYQGLWDIIESYAGDVQEVIDVGCGDLRFWKGRECEQYTGIDLSETIIERNRCLRPTWKFISGNAAHAIPIKAKANVVLCLGLLFHVFDEGEYQAILKNLVKYSKKWIFIYTWRKNPLATLFNPQRTQDSYQIYRDFEKYVPMIEACGAKLVTVHFHPQDKWGAMYIFSIKPRLQSADRYS